MLGGLEPLNSTILGLFSPISIILVAGHLKDKPVKETFLCYFTYSFFITLFAFNWIVPGLINLTHLSLPITILLFLIYSVLFNLKLLFIFIGYQFFAKFVGGVWLLAGLGALADIIVYQVFPWYFGNLISGFLEIRQIASITGVYGISFLSFLLAFWVINDGLILLNYLKKGKSISPRLFGFQEGIVLRLLVVSAVLFGYYRVFTIKYPDTDKIHIGYIQPDTGIGLKENKSYDEYMAEAYIRIARLSLKLIYETKAGLDLLILPESAAPFYGTNDSEENKKNNIYSPTYHAIIAFLAKTGKQDILYNEMEWQNGVHNSATIFGREGKRKLSYHKQRLVPFGEYLPDIFSFAILRKLFPEVSDYKKGDRAVLLPITYSSMKKSETLPPLSEESLSVLSNVSEILNHWETGPAEKEALVAGLICYEGLFPELVREFYTEQRKPDFIVNIVNDSWFGNYLENYQHSGAAKLRAVENGTYFIRITLGGISSVTGPLGEMIERDTLIHEIGAYHFQIPVNSKIPTIYSRFGNTIIYLIIISSFLLGYFFKKSGQN